MTQEQELIETKKAWDLIAEIAEERLIYFENRTQKEIRKAIYILDKYIYKK